MSISTQSTVKERTQESGKTTLGFKSAAAPTIGETRHKMIAEAAYFLAQRRGFFGNHAMEDWLKAEDQVHAMLAKTDARR